MSDFDPHDAAERYGQLRRERPERFVNPPGDIYEILFDESRIAHARAEAARARTAQGLSAEDTRVGVLAVDPYLLLMREAVRFADGSYGLYNRLMVPAGAAVLPRPRRLARADSSVPARHAKLAARGPARIVHRGPAGRGGSAPRAVRGNRRARRTARGPR